MSEERIDWAAFDAMFSYDPLLNLPPAEWDMQGPEVQGFEAVEER